MKKQIWQDFPLLCPLFPLCNSIFTRLFYLRNQLFISFSYSDLNSSKGIRKCHLYPGVILFSISFVPLSSLLLVFLTKNGFVILILLVTFFLPMDRCIYRYYLSRNIWIQAYLLMYFLLPLLCMEWRHQILQCLK